MKITLSTEQAVQMLINDENASWSLQGAIALVEHLEHIDQDMDVESEIDLIAIRCDYAEYGSAVEALAEYTGDKVEDEDEAMEHLLNETGVIQFHGGIIIQDF